MRTRYSCVIGYFLALVYCSSIAILIPILTAILSRPAAAAGCVLRVGYSIDPPWTFNGADGLAHGTDPDLTREALRLMQCEGQFIQLPWARAVKQIEEGKIDLLPGLIKTEKRELFAYFSSPLQKSRVYLFVRNALVSRYSLKSINDFAHADFLFGVEFGANFGQYYENIVSDQNFSRRTIPFASMTEAWRMMGAGRLDALISDETTALRAIHDLAITDKVVRTDILISDSPSRVGFSRKTADLALVAKFDRAVEEMIRNGSYTRILESDLPCHIAVQKLGCE